MKVLTGCVYHETNTFNPNKTNLKNFVLDEGNSINERLASTEVFNENKVEVIPSIYATALSSGIVTYETFRYLSDKILSIVKTNQDIDGVWLHLHGSMVVENIGSGDLQLLKEVREVIGDGIPISLTLDIHANIPKELSKYANIIYSYRTVPHTDQFDIERKTANLLIEAIKDNEVVNPIIIDLPIIIPGEKALASDEPLKTILEKLYEIEDYEEIASANFFICHAWNDTVNTRSSVVVSPKNKKSISIAFAKAKELADYIFRERKNFDFNAEVLSPRKAIQKAVNLNENLIFISDSGDNSTAGAQGNRVDMLEVTMNEDLKDKKVLISAIYDETAFVTLDNYNINDNVSLYIGTPLNEKVKFNGVVKSKGDLMGYLNATNDKVGETITISNNNIDLIVSNSGESFITLNHFKKANVNVNDYDIIIVKQGYLFNELSNLSDKSILSLTQGETYQLIENIDYKNILRPIYPIDDV
ncbi:M81 family metallopeptidase [Mammaliicoccus lentus]|jgi:microcystin degradation protein MlrC|uniref:M81 family metallopeptidase n=1 Tax=Mammaliicoccus lentus TaxID=42858 RepID=A0AAX3W6J7_MAMLE|nr:M81 family metallopeptidase [Mammaliicoccus lentus]MBU6114325.1 M81 family metallopeptidase [Mammaliicoccus lentus]WHI60577.1 M81 family metallopeptidase [Mammaliicoccus lentus]